MSEVSDCKIVRVPQFERAEGTISVVQGGEGEVPFDIARVFYVYDVVAGAVRGGHAHLELEQFIICPMGGFEVKLWDGTRTRTERLDRPYMGLYVPPMIWTDLVDFTSGAVCMVLASRLFDERDYFRDRTTYLQTRMGESGS